MCFIRLANGRTTLGTVFLEQVLDDRFISWDVATSEVCRDIDPRTDGIMLGMSLTSDNRFAAAFTR